MVGFATVEFPLVKAPKLFDRCSRKGAFAIRAGLLSLYSAKSPQI
jgi:hypothetical protein